MQNFKCICKLYNEINLNLYIGPLELELKSILPKRFCPLAFHSVYPYMVTLLNGGWFSWVGYDEHVIVNCPSPEGIAMYVKAPAKDTLSLIEVEVMQENKECYKGYGLKDRFIFNFNEENQFNFKVLDSVIPFISYTDKNSGQANELFCNIEANSIRIKWCQDKRIKLP